MRILGILLMPFIWLGVHEFKGGWFSHLISGLLRLACIFALSGALLVFLTKLFLTPTLPLKSEVDREIEKIESLLASSQLEESNIDLANVKLRTASILMGDERDVVLKNQEKKFYKLITVCDKCAEIGGEGEIILYEIKPLMAEFDFLHKFLPTNNWPFYQIEFFSGPYVFSAQMIEASISGGEEGGRELDNSEIEKLRAIIDNAVGGLPSPNQLDLVSARRLMGPIQLACYLLFSFALINLFLSHMSTVFPNYMARMHKRIRLKGETIKDTDGRQVLFFDPDNENGYGCEIPVPWSDSHHIEGTSHDFERFFSKLHQKFTGMFSFPRVSPVIPVTELRRIGYMAMQSDPSASNVPAFISAQADSFFELFEAHSKSMQFLIWAIPTLGFVGTVLGIGEALLATVDIQSSVLSKNSAAESSVGSSIGVAFDTTFVALILSFVLMFLYYALQNAQEKIILFEKRTALQEIIQPGNVQQPLSSEHAEALLKRFANDINRADPAVSPPYSGNRNQQTISEGRFPILKIFVLIIVLGGALYTAINYWDTIAGVF